ncbi:MAG: hypothetical protein B6I20_11910 [Bacteroidetes bacterium 4572_117]|nr:MAG: hypothetical protein B6I20_11910 [Bacteroidetes bacterium 4572_117]
MTTPKKILVFIDWFLPGYKAGGPIRSLANLTAHLSGEFEFFIVTRNKDYLESVGYEDVVPNEWLGFAKNINVYYFSQDQLSIKNIKKIISTQDYDVAYINGVYSFYFSILPVYLLKKSTKKIVVATRGMLLKHSFSSKKIKKKIFIYLTNLIGLFRNVFFHVTNEQEKKEVSELINKQKGFLIAPNLSAKITNKQIAPILKSPGKLKLVNIARISVEKNTLFALQVLAASDYTGIIEFDLYGAIYSNKYWEECLETINSLPDNINVCYKGMIDNKKVPETLLKYHFSFLPSLGENFGHSILESFLAGCPVIISDQTPWKNLEEKKIGWDIPIDPKDDFVKTIQYCIDMEQAEYGQLSKNAFKYAKAFADNKKLIGQSRDLFKI